ncbi:hypothetical protein CYLTODRAFT_417659 [Cylindrobasidium torrendii FP15055 ss-10]|uniref:Uncharacterized protein n=1 Tax=Cylindrobasidium torrendii FP15055 ss-10 TaxID=1314674 RepID=A0A0D7BQ12_9AGAR|nr:hypothetical protein CYLTODRAFT_417659 [Cylindrobasidium torrendii FP15055 ss-10]
MTSSHLCAYHDIPLHFDGTSSDGLDFPKVLNVIQTTPWTPPLSVYMGPVLKRFPKTQKARTRKQPGQDIFLKHITRRMSRMSTSSESDDSSEGSANLDTELEREQSISDAATYNLAPEIQPDAVRPHKPEGEPVLATPSRSIADEPDVVSESKRPRRHRRNCHGGSSRVHPYAA